MLLSTVYCNSFGFNLFSFQHSGCHGEAGRAQKEESQKEEMATIKLFPVSNRLTVGGIKSWARFTHTLALRDECVSLSFGWHGKV